METSGCNKEAGNDVNFNEFWCCLGTQRIFEDTHFEVLLLALSFQAPVILFLLACCHLSRLFQWDSGLCTWTDFHQANRTEFCM